MTTVAVALIQRAGQILICRRRADQSHAGTWDFPGGKVEAGESPREALGRELREELHIAVAKAEERLRYDFAYAGKPAIRLVFFAVTEFSGRIDGSQFDEVRWEYPEALSRYDFLEGDERIVRELAVSRASVALLPAARPPSGTIC